MRRSSPGPLVVLALSLGVLGGCTPTRSAGNSPSVVSSRAAAVSSTPLAEPAPGRPADLEGYARPSKSELEARLTPLQFEVTQNAATEPPFQNAYWDNHEAGIYVDVATGEPLFSSGDKFDSGTGWPSFSRPIEDGHVVEHSDETLGMARTEVVSKAGGSHLGHVFNDGPKPTRMRYCINSASLRFVPVARLVAEGYGAYAPRFAGVAAASVADAPVASNSCTFPKPGEAPGCSATLDVAIFAQADRDADAAKRDGVLEVARGFEGAQAAVEVTFDPAKLTYEDLLTSWTRGREEQSKVFARNEAQRRAAAAKSLRVADAVPFQRQ